MILYALFEKVAMHMMEYYDELVMDPFETIGTCLVEASHHATKGLMHHQQTQPNGLIGAHQVTIESDSLAALLCHQD
jgi:hypothetical protein